MKLTRKDKEERAERFNISVSTYYNWEKEKPELIKIIELGLQKEFELNNNVNVDNLDEAVKKIFPKIEELEKKIQKLEEEKNK